MDFFLSLVHSFLNFLKRKKKIPTTLHNVSLVPITLESYTSNFSCTPNAPKVKLSEDKLIATRVCDDFQFSFVTLGKSLLPYEFIVVQILKINPQLVGGIKLYLKDLENESSPKVVYSDSEGNLNSYQIFWMNEHCVLKCLKDEQCSNLCSDCCEYELFIDLYGCVEQIRAYMGCWEGKDSYSNSPPENNSSEPESNEKASLSNTREIANNTPNGYMVLYMKHDEVEKICVFNLPGMNTTSSSPSRASPENNSLLTVHDRSSRNNQTVSEECKICMDAVANVVLIPCGHMGFCYNCSAKVAVRTTTCPICRIDIESWQTIHHQSSFCKVCETSPANIVLRPCGDMCLCHSCSDGIKQCPICRMPTATMQKIFQN